MQDPLVDLGTHWLLAGSEPYEPLRVDPRSSPLRPPSPIPSPPLTLTRFLLESRHHRGQTPTPARPPPCCPPLPSGLWPSSVLLQCCAPFPSHQEYQPLYQSLPLCLEPRAYGTTGSCSAHGLTATEIKNFIGQEIVGIQKSKYPIPVATFYYVSLPDVLKLENFW
ncbi:hypothetical protein PAHAL_6G129900 [Panicum hallii]|uniref:Uncharacterized protein n=1 Tax=Panicum hallii TaxID=206008 RepID=A0A2T8IGB2_9POAL|nr:hypothetical protein PAHAL_6G129900 [Panicum hallii]